jgi:hypothetical protein
MSLAGGSRWPWSASPSASERRIAAATWSCRRVGSDRSILTSSMTLFIVAPVEHLGTVSVAAHARVRLAGVIDTARRRYRRRRRRRLIVLLTVACVGVAAWISTGNGGRGSPPGAHSAVTAVTSHRLRTFMSRFAILRHPRGAGYQPPPARILAHLFGEGGRPAFLGAGLGLDRTMIRMAAPTSGVRMWLIPGRSGFCAFERTGGGGAGACGPYLLDDVLLGVTPVSGNVEGVGGFVADGNRTVTVTLRDRRRLLVPVNNNAFSCRSEPRSASPHSGPSMCPARRVRSSLETRLSRASSASASEQPRLHDRTDPCSPLPPETCDIAIDARPRVRGPIHDRDGFRTPRRVRSSRRPRLTREPRADSLVSRARAPRAVAGSMIRRCRDEPVRASGVGVHARRRSPVGTRWEAATPESRERRETRQSHARRFASARCRH